MSVDAIIAAAAAIAAADPTLQELGLKRVYPDAPEQAADVPALILTPHAAKRAWPSGSNLRAVTHEITLQLLIGRGDLPGADQLAKRFITALFDVFDAHITLNQTVTAAGITAYEYGHVVYGGVDYLAVHCTLTAEERVRVAYQP